jgi:hypothetical protein
MDASGNYVVKISDQETKKLSDVTQDEFDKLIKEQKNQPKSMEEIARAGMKTSDVIKNDVAAIKGAIVRGAASTTFVKDNVEAVRKAATIPLGIASDRGAKTEIYSKQFETLSGSIRDAAKELMKSGGKSMGEVLKDLGSKFGKQGEDVKKVVEQLGTQVYNDLKKSDLRYRSSEVGDFTQNAKDALQNYIDKTDFGKKAALQSGTSTPVAKSKSLFLSGTDALTNKENQNQTLTSTINKTVDYSGTVVFKVEAPAGVSKQYLEQFLNDEKFKEMVYKYVEEKNKQLEKTK